jgi:hypothetical protein
MANIRAFLVTARIRLIYFIAVLLVLLVPILFFAFGSGLVEKVGRKIPLREGRFSATGELQLDRSDVRK